MCSPGHRSRPDGRQRAGISIAARAGFPWLPVSRPRLSAVRSRGCRDLGFIDHRHSLPELPVRARVGIVKMLLLIHSQLSQVVLPSIAPSGQPAGWPGTCWQLPVVGYPQDASTGLSFVVACGLRACPQSPGTRHRKPNGKRSYAASRGRARLRALLACTPWPTDISSLSGVRPPCRK
jgi:hypothetical protein